VALAINGTKLTGRMVKAAIASYLAHRKTGKCQDVIPHGKQTVKQLVGQNQGVSNVELTDPSIRAFERIARKYGVDYAVKRDRASDPPRFLIFFKSRDADALTAAMQEYAGKKVRRIQRPSVLQRLAQLRSQVKKPTVDREKRKEQTR
jgi:hypothetical protein